MVIANSIFLEIVPCRQTNYKNHRTILGIQSYTCGYLINFQLREVIRWDVNIKILVSHCKPVPAKTGTDCFLASEMSLSDMLALLSLLLNILGTVATILAAIFGYQNRKQSQGICEFEKWIPIYKMAGCFACAVVNATELQPQYTLRRSPSAATV